MKGEERMKRFEVVAPIACTLLVAACAAKQPAPLPPPTVAVSESRGKGTGMQESVVTATARVEAIDQKTRMVTLRGPDGKDFTFRAGEEVKNLPQVRKGDLVNVQYYESIAYQVKKKGKPDVAAAEELATAPVGSMPAAAGGRVLTLTAKITKIDRATNTVTLKGPRGREVPIKVK